VSKKLGLLCDSFCQSPSIAAGLQPKRPQRAPSHCELCKVIRAFYSGIACFFPRKKYAKMLQVRRLPVVAIKTTLMLFDINVDETLLCTVYRFMVIYVI
jgi:hypothetical protein